MMQAALLNNRLVLAASQSLNSSAKYICPDCGQQVRLCHLTRGHAYFEHEPGASCDSAHETNIHRLGKQQIKNWLEQQGYRTWLETYLAAIKQRPDILTIIDHQPVAIEFQCSPLSLQRLMERNQGYRHLGIMYRWFLGPTYARRLRPSKMAQFLQYHRQLCLPFWNLQARRPEYYDWRCVPNVSRYRPRQDIWQTLIQQTRRLQSQVRRANQDLSLLANWAYRLGHGALSTCPLVVHDTHRQWYLIDQSPLIWRLRILLQLESKPLYTSWSLAAWYAFLEQMSNWLALPCLNDAQVRLLRQRMLDRYTQELNLAGIIKLDSRKVIYYQRPVWFVNYEHKMTYLNQRKFS